MVHKFSTIENQSDHLGKSQGVASARSMVCASTPGFRALRGFVIGEENRLAAWAIEHCACDEPPRQTPLFLFGESGVGKSHLIRSLEQEWNEADNGLAIFTTAADFAREVAAAIETQDLEPLRERYRLARLVVIEDLGRLEDKVAAQHELVSLLEAGETLDSRLVVTGPLPPRELPGVSARLRDRLSAGLVVCVARPSPETRAEIVRRLAIQRDIRLTTEAATLLGQEVEGGAQDLLRALLEVNSSFESTTIESIALETTGVERIDSQIGAVEVQQYLARRTEISRLTLPQLLAATARYFALTQAVIKSSQRSQCVATARGVAMYLARQQTTESLKSIGRFFGGRDHTTVLHNCRKIEQLIKTDSEIRLAAETIASVAQGIQ